MIGPNGAGKSTLIKALLGLIPRSQGQVLFHGVPLKRHRHRVAYVPQRSQIDWDYPITAWNVVMSPDAVMTLDSIQRAYGSATPGGQDGTADSFLMC